MKEKTKGFIAGVLFMVMVAGAVMGVAGESIQKTATLFYNNIKICIDGVFIEPKDANGNIVEPFTINGTTYLPVRAVANAFNEPVDWDGNTSTVYIGSKPGETDISFEAFEQALSQKGITFEKITKAATLVGAVEGYGYKINGTTVEMYKFDAASESYITAKNNNKLTLESFNMSFDAVFNNEYCIINGNEEIIDIFNKL